MGRNIIVRLPPPPPFKGRSANPPASIALKGRSFTPSYTSPLTEEIHLPQSTASRPPPTIDDASPVAANRVTLPLRERSTGPNSNGNHGDDDTMQSRLLCHPVSHNCPRENDTCGEGNRWMSKCADEGIHKSAGTSLVTRMQNMFEQVPPEQQSLTASRTTAEDFSLKEPSPLVLQPNNAYENPRELPSQTSSSIRDSSYASPPSYNAAQESQSSLSSTSSFSGHVSKRSSRSSKGRRHGQLGQQPLSLELERLAYSSTAADEKTSERDRSPPASLPPGQLKSSERPLPRVTRSGRDIMDPSSPFAGLSQHSTLSAPSNLRVVSRVSKRPSSAKSRTSQRRNQRAQQRFSIERCLKLVPEADSSIHNARVQRLSIAKENTEKLLKGAMDYAYRYLRRIEPNLPDITLDGLEAIVNDLVHTINNSDASRAIKVQGGRLGGQLLDSALAEDLEGNIMSCEQDAEFDPIIQLPPWYQI